MQYRYTVPSMAKDTFFDFHRDISTPDSEIKRFFRTVFRNNNNTVELGRTLDIIDASYFFPGP